MKDSRKVFNVFLSPLKQLYLWLLEKRNYYVGLHNPKKRIDEVHKEICGKPIDWENPTDLNEKINWLKVYTDTSLWSELADKYGVRKYVEEKGFGSLLVPLYGYWTNVDDIDFGKLPDSFVLKDTHGSGNVIIVKDKNQLDEKKTRKRLRKWLKTRYGVSEGEVHYKDIVPGIIAEQLLEDNHCSFSKSLVDYKVWSFDGEPYSVRVYYNRTADYVYIGQYDKEWNYHPEYSKFTNHFRDGKDTVPKPATLGMMLNAAAVLSKGFPEVRVDFYEVNGKLYFGEMTFTSSGGHMDSYTDDYLIELGNQTKLPL